MLTGSGLDGEAVEASFVIDKVIARRSPHSASQVPILIPSQNSHAAPLLVGNFAFVAPPPLLTSKSKSTNTAAAPNSPAKRSIGKAWQRVRNTWADFCDWADDLEVNWDKRSPPRADSKSHEDPHSVRLHSGFRFVGGGALADIERAPTAVVKTKRDIWEDIKDVLEKIADELESSVDDLPVGGHTKRASDAAMTTKRDFWEDVEDLLHKIADELESSYDDLPVGGHTKRAEKKRNFWDTLMDWKHDIEDFECSLENDPCPGGGEHHDQPHDKRAAGAVTQEMIIAAGATGVGEKLDTDTDEDFDRLSRRAPQEMIIAAGAADAGEKLDGDGDVDLPALHLVAKRAPRDTRWTKGWWQSQHQQEKSSSTVEEEEGEQNPLESVIITGTFSLPNPAYAGAEETAEFARQFGHAW